MAATLAGWAPLAILDAYEAERRPIADETSGLTMGFALKIIKQRREISAEIELPGPVGSRGGLRTGFRDHSCEVKRSETKQE
jgi:hypothetical protein